MSSASTRYSEMSGGTTASMPSARVTRFLLSEYLACSGGEHAAVDLLLQQRMIVRELLEAVDAQPIAARVADVADADAILEEHGRDQRRAHAGAFGTRLRRLVDALVGQRDLLLQQQRRVREPAADVDLRKLAARIELLQHAVADDVDGDAAGDFARAVSAHAVGEHREPGFAVDEDRVLVVRAHHAGMRQAGHVERRPGAHAGFLQRETGLEARSKSIGRECTLRHGARRVQHVRITLSPGECDAVSAKVRL